jgi:predicted XRE-type DNA-binding protein
MRGKHTKIELSADERSELERFSKTGKRSVRLVNRAKIILDLDEADARKPLTQVQIAEKIGVTRQAVNDAKKAYFASESVSMFLQRKKRETPPVTAKITGDVEARIIALACSSVPQGCAKWSVRLLAEKCVDLNYIDAISFKSVQRVLKKHNLSRT